MSEHLKAGVPPAGSASADATVTRRSCDLLAETEQCEPAKAGLNGMRLNKVPR